MANPIIYGKVGLDQYVSDSFKAIGTKLGITIPVRTEGWYALRKTVEDAAKQISVAKGTPVAFDASSPTALSLSLATVVPAILAVTAPAYSDATASFLSYSRAGLSILTPALAPGDSMTGIVPNDGRATFNAAGTQVILGLSASAPGQTTYTVNTALGGSFQLTATASAIVRPLGPLSMAFATGSAPGLTVAAITGLKPGEIATSIAANTNFAISSDGLSFITGSGSATATVATAGLLVTTNQGRSFTVSGRVSAALNAFTANYFSRANAVAAKPAPTTDMVVMDDYVLARMASGSWAAMDAIYWRAAWDRAASMINIKSGNYASTITGTVTHTPYVGLTGDGATGYVSTNFNPSTAGGNFSANSQLVAVFLIKSNKITGGSYAVGTNASIYGPRLQFSSSVGGKKELSGYLGNGTTNNASWTAATTIGSGDTPGLATMNRVGVSDLRFYKNDLLLTGSAPTSAATGVSPTPILEFRNSTSYSAETISFSEYGGAKTDAQVAADFTALKTFLHATMKPVAFWGDSLTGTTTNNLTFDPTDQWPQDVANDMGVSVCYIGAVGGTTTGQIADRMLSDTFFNGGRTVLWPGRNDVSTDPNCLVNTHTTVTSMVNHVANGNFLLLGVINTLDEYIGSTAGAGETGYTAIINEMTYRTATYGSKAVDVRTPLVAVFNPDLPQDVIDHGRNTPPTSSRAISNTSAVPPTIDHTHENLNPGYITVRAAVDAAWLANAMAA